MQIAIIYSYGANEEEAADNGLLDEENSEDTSALVRAAGTFWRKQLQRIIMRCSIQIMIS